MFKRICKAMLKEENYMDALAYCATRLLKASDVEAEFDRIDEKLWDLAMSADGIDDASENRGNFRQKQRHAEIYAQSRADHNR